jgi:hypothetical protein
MHELCRVPPCRYHNAHCVGDALSRIVNFLEPLAKGVERDPNDGVGLRIEVWPSSQGFDRNGVLLDLVTAPCCGFFADVTQYFNQVCGPTQGTGFQQPVELCTLRVLQSFECYRGSHRGDHDSRSFALP